MADESDAVAGLSEGELEEGELSSSDEEEEEEGGGRAPDAALTRSLAREPAPEGGERAPLPALTGAAVEAGQEVIIYCRLAAQHRSVFLKHCRMFSGVHREITHEGENKQLTSVAREEQLLWRANMPLATVPSEAF